ncbi:unnamed protein product, partial [Durusdinium trenchii]
LDWLGVPQLTSKTDDAPPPEAAKAIQSIPGYVERSLPGDDRLMVSSLVQKSVAMKIQHESEAGSLAYLRYLLTGQFHLSRSVL